MEVAVCVRTRHVRIEIMSVVFDRSHQKALSGQDRKEPGDQGRLAGVLYAADGEDLCLFFFHFREVSKLQQYGFGRIPGL